MDNENSLILENRKTLRMSGVVSVNAFNENLIRLTLASGALTINGNGLKIEGFNKQNGNLVCVGDFVNFRFGNAVPLVKKLFK